MNRLTVLCLMFSLSHPAFAQDSENSQKLINISANCAGDESEILGKGCVRHQMHKLAKRVCISRHRILSQRPKVRTDCNTSGSQLVCRGRAQALCIAPDNVAMAVSTN